MEGGDQEKEAWREGRQGELIDGQMFWVKMQQFLKNSCYQLPDTFFYNLFCRQGNAGVKPISISAKLLQHSTWVIIM